MSMKKNKLPPEMVGNQMNEFSSTTKISPPVIGEYHEKDELYNPFEHRDKTDANSDVASLAHMIKSSLGSGILAMPNAIKNGGLYFGGIGTIILGIICAHCVHILVRSAQVLCKRTKTPMLTYAETAQVAFQCGPPPVRKYANFMKLSVNVSLSAAYIGGACVYVVFIGTTIKQIADYHTSSDTDQRLFMVALLPAVILLSQIRNLKWLVPFSMFANVAIMVGLALTLYFIFKEIQPISSVEKIARFDQMPFFFATVIFAIEGIGVVMPVENSMQQPNHFLGCPSVLNITMTIVIALYAMVGIFGYLAYGEKTEAIVTLNLNIEDPLAQAVKLLIALAILFTYGLQFFVPLEIVCSVLRPKLSHRFAGFGETGIRVLMAIMTVVIAIAVPTLQPFIALVGAVCFSILGICIPAVVETISCWEAHLGRFNWRLWKNILLLLFAVFALVTGTIVSVHDIIDEYNK